MKRKGYSLRWWLAAIVAVCWLLPMAAILYFSGYFLTGSYQSRVRDTVTTSVDNALTQVENRLSSAIDASRASSYDDAIRSAYRDYQVSGDSVVLYGEVTDYITGKYAYNNSFRATVLFFPDGPDDIYYAYNRHVSGVASELRGFLKNVYGPVREKAAALGTGVGFLTAGDSLYMIRNLVDSSFHPYAVLVMECSAPVLFESVESVVWLEGAELSVDGLPCVSYGDGAGGVPERDGVVKLDNGGRYRVTRTASVGGHTLCLSAVSDGTQLTEEFPRLMTIFAIFLFVAVPLLAVTVWAFGRQVTMPVNALVAAANRVEAGERGAVVERLPRNQEMRRLTEHFNSMSQELERQFDRSYEEQLALQDARIKALQSQITPHFLCNTLEIINWEARMSGDVKVSRMIEALSQMLDAATARGGDASGTIAEELRYADAYLYIISERFGERLTVHREVDESVLGVAVPRLILQPIVENAVEHGVSQLPRGELTLRVRAGEGAVVLEVEHDGRMTEADREAIRRLLSPEGEEPSAPKSGRVGIRNVNRRLKLLYGDRSGLKITELGEQRILARIIVPNAQ